MFATEQRNIVTHFSYYKEREREGGEREGEREREKERERERDKERERGEGEERRVMLTISSDFFNVVLPAAPSPRRKSLTTSRGTVSFNVCWYSRRCIDFKTTSVYGITFNIVHNTCYF